MILRKADRLLVMGITGKQGTEPGRSIDTVSDTGQYL